MSTQSVICDWLVAGEDLGTLIADRLYAFMEPEAAASGEQLKSVVYRVITTNHEPMIDGQYTEKTTFAFLCGDASYDGAHEVADALVARLYAAIGQEFADAQGASQRVLEALLVDRFDDDAQTSREAGVFVVYVEFSIQIR